VTNLSPGLCRFGRTVRRGSRYSFGCACQSRMWRSSLAEALIELAEAMEPNETGDLN
jgi:hypothetical protein